MMDDVVSATHSTHVLCCGHSASSYGIEGEPANAEAVVNTQDDALLLKSSQRNESSSDNAKCSAA